MEIEFIKKCVEKTEGFEMDSFGDVRVLDARHGCSINTKVFKYVYYPLLAQQAIEGINREYVEQDNGRAILQSEKAIVVYICYHREKVFYYRDYGNETGAKSAALQWIFDDEEAYGG